MPDRSEFDSVSKMIKGHLSVKKEQADEALRANEALIREQTRRLEESLERKMAELVALEKKSTDKLQENREKENPIIHKLVQDQVDKEVAKRLKKDMAQAPSNARHQSKFRVPKGTTIFVPMTLVKDAGQKLQPADFEAITSSRDVAYDPEDVCMNPTTGECTLDNLRQSLYFTDENYFAFRLPPNDRKIPFILVPRQHVQIKMSDGADPTLQNFLDEVLRQKDWIKNG